MRNFVFCLIFVLLPVAVFAEEVSASEVFYFFYSDSCPHCHEAMPFVEELEKEYPDIKFKKLELSKDEVNRAVFLKKADELGMQGRGVPTFVFKDKYIMGFKKGSFEEKIREMIGKPVKKPATRK
jgi:Thioredoxin domain-containing protein